MFIVEPPPPPPPVVAKKHHSDDDDVSRAAGAGCRVLKEGEGDGREDAYHAASVWGRGPDTETGAHKRLLAAYDSEPDLVLSWQQRSYGCILFVRGGLGVVTTGRCAAPGPPRIAARRGYVARVFSMYWLPLLALRGVA